LGKAINYSLPFVEKVTFVCCNAIIIVAYKVTTQKIA